MPEGSSTQARSKARKPPAGSPGEASPLALYRAAQRQVRAERGERCECCGVAAKATHHVNPVASTGIDSVLFSDLANLLIVCDDCHTLFHPGKRVYPWISVGVRRSNVARKGGLG